jgi:5'-3' exonuclease
MRKLLLIDGDQFLFTACVAVEQEIRWDDQNHVLWSNSALARQNFDGMVQRIFDRFKTEEHVMCFSTEPDKANFRLSIDSSYKGHRQDRKPLCYAQLRRDIEADYKCHAVDHLEADDLMGILATKPNQKRTCVIVSRDKDMKTIPTSIWNGEDLIVQSLADADRFHMYQTLCGDTADGYPGCPGMGDVSATALLDAPGIWTPYDHELKSGKRKGEKEQRWKLEPTDNVWAGVVSCFEREGLTEAGALVQARLSRILRHSDWDNVSMKPILWTP